MKTWNETKAEVLAKLKDRLPQTKEGQLTFHYLQNHPTMEPLLDAIVGIFREAEVAKAYVEQAAKVDADREALERLDNDGGVVNSYGTTQSPFFDRSTKTQIDTAVGLDLDELGKQLGVDRHYDPFVHAPEPDANYRERLNAAFRLLNGPNRFTAQDANETPDLHVSERCECGAHALGYKQPGPGHSSWCPQSKGE